MSSQNRNHIITLWTCWRCYLYHAENKKLLGGFIIV